MQAATLLIAAAWFMFGLISFGLAADVETVLDDLDNPCGVAIQPGSGHIFLSDSGAGRVIRVVDGQAEEVVVGFDRDVYGEGPAYHIGPLGLVLSD